MGLSSICRQDVRFFNVASVSFFVGSASTPAPPFLYPLQQPACLLSGGETTVQIRGIGKGGRNQEFVLAASLKMTGLDNVVVLSAGTDGTDGPTDAAGAIVDSTILDKAQSIGLDPLSYLDNNDSYHFFEKLGDLYKTGPTNTNVMDLRIILVC